MRGAWISMVLVLPQIQQKARRQNHFRLFLLSFLWKWRERLKFKFSETEGGEGVVSFCPAWNWSHCSAGVGAPTMSLWNGLRNVSCFQRRGYFVYLEQRAASVKLVFFSESQSLILKGLISYSVSTWELKGLNDALGIFCPQPSNMLTTKKLRSAKKSWKGQRENYDGIQWHLTREPPRTQILSCQSLLIFWHSRESCIQKNWQQMENKVTFYYYLPGLDKARLEHMVHS